MKASESIQESLFVALDSDEVDEDIHFPAKVLFDTVEYRKATEGYDDATVIMIDKLQERFKEYFLPNEIFESDNQNEVAIVFERINRAGTELNIFQLLSAWSWSEDFDLSDKFNELQADIIEHDFDDLCKNQDLQLRICAGVIKGETLPSKILEMQGEEIRNNFNIIRNGILGAIDYLKRELNVKSYRLLPFPGLLVLLAVFFSTESEEGVRYTETQNNKIKKWFWRSIFSRRFSAGVNERQAFDIIELKKLKKDENYDFQFPPDDIKIDFKKANFSIGNANSKSFILLLSQLTPYSFLSGAKIDLDCVLQRVNSNEFHHIYPKNYLEEYGYDNKEINVIANICFLSRGDNNKISNKAPEEYEKLISNDKKNEYLQNALCPPTFKELKYDDFLQIRESLITHKIWQLCK